MKLGIKHRNFFINAIASLLFILAGLLLVILISYMWPRQIVDASPPLTQKEAYAIGDEVFVTGHTKIYITGSDTNDVRLVCGTTQFFIKQVELQVKPIDTDYVFSLGQIPRQAESSPPPCKFVTVTTYRVKFFLGLTRTYQHTFTTNEFIIEG